MKPPRILRKRKKGRKRDTESASVDRSARKSDQDAPLVRRRLRLDMLPQRVRKLESLLLIRQDLLVERNDVSARVLGGVVLVVDRSDTGVLDEGGGAEGVFEFGGGDLEAVFKRVRWEGGWCAGEWGEWEVSTAAKEKGEDRRRQGGESGRREEKEEGEERRTP
jgi:hypothetical protein